MAEEKEERYCLDCESRKHQLTDKNNFCEVGYQLNPGSKKATKNVLFNGGEVCRFNPWRDKIKQDMLAKHWIERNKHIDTQTS